MRKEKESGRHTGQKSGGVCVVPALEGKVSPADDL